MQSPLNNDHLLAVNNTCGGTLTGASGEISSPNFPGPYDNQLDCQWLIVVDPALGVHLELFSLDLEGICTHDSLQVGEGLTVGALSSSLSAASAPAPHYHFHVIIIVVAIVVVVVVVVVVVIIIIIIIISIITIVIIIMCCGWMGSKRLHLVIDRLRDRFCGEWPFSLRSFRVESTECELSRPDGRRKTIFRALYPRKN